MSLMRFYLKLDWYNSMYNVFIFFFQGNPSDVEDIKCTTITPAKKRRLRRKKLQQARNLSMKYTTI